MKLIVILTLGLCLFLPSLCLAEPLRFDQIEPGTAELGIYTGYGGNHRYPDATRHLFTFDVVGFRIGTYITQRSEIVYSFGIGTQVFRESNSGAWSTLGYHYNYRVHPDESLGFLICTGVMRFRNSVPELATRTNFVSQLGFSYKKRAANDAAWVYEYRFSHVSNANMRVPNIGINASMITVGYCWYK